MRYGAGGATWLGPKVAHSTVPTGACRMAPVARHGMALAPMRGMGRSAAPSMTPPAICSRPPAEARDMTPAAAHGTMSVPSAAHSMTPAAACNIASVVLCCSAPTAVLDMGPALACGMAPGRSILPACSTATVFVKAGGTKDPSACLFMKW